MPRKGDEIRRRERAETSSAPNKACRGTTKAQKPCPAPATTDGYCPMHSPRYTEAERKAWRARGQATAAKARLPQTFVKADFSTGARARAVLEDCADLTRRGRMPVSVCNAVTKAVAAAARLGELELAAQVNELERQLTERSGKKR